MTMKHKSGPAIALAAAMGWACGAQATVIVFDDFSTSTGLTINGDAATGVDNGIDADSVLRLTPATGSQSGSAFSTASINASTFSTAFQFRITDPGGAFDGTSSGADGITFTVQNVSSSIGGGGGGIGYLGIDDSIAVEFDTWHNGFDPSSNHLGVDRDGSLTSLATIDITPRFDDGGLWHVWIDYDGTTLETRLNQTGVRPGAATLSYDLDIVSILGSTTAFVGFTSGTGAAWGNHDIVRWEYRDEFRPIDTPEPASLALIGLGLAGLGLSRRKRVTRR